MRELKQSTAVTVLIGPAINAANGTPNTGLSIAQSDVLLSKNGGDPAIKNAAGGGTHKANGDYAVSFDATDTGTLGSVKLTCYKAGCLPVIEYFEVITAEEWDRRHGTGQVVLSQTAKGLLDNLPLTLETKEIIAVRGRTKTIPITLSTDWDLTGKTVYFCAKKNPTAENDTAIVNRACTVLGPQSATITLTPAETATVDRYYCEVVVFETGPPEANPRTPIISVLEIVQDVRQ